MAITPIDAIKTLVVTSLVPMIDKFPLLKDLIDSSKSSHPVDEWDFFMISACAGVILLTSENHSGEHEIIRNQLRELDEEYLLAVDDLAKFMEKVPEDELDQFIATLGYWVLWNVKKDKPTDAELQQLSLPIGKYVIYLVSRIRQEKIGEI